MVASSPHLHDFELLSLAARDSSQSRLGDTTCSHDNLFLFINERDEEFIRQSIPAEDLLGFIHFNPEIMDADRQGLSPYDCSPSAIEEIRKIKGILDQDQ